MWGDCSLLLDSFRVEGQTIDTSVCLLLAAHVLRAHDRDRFTYASSYDSDRFTYASSWIAHTISLTVLR